MARRQLFPQSASPYHPSNSAGGSSVEAWDAEVTTLTELNAQIGDGKRVLITANIAVTGTNQINLFSGRCTIGRKPECQIIQTGSAALFQLGSSVTCDVTLETVGEDREKLPFIDTSGGTATYLASGDSGALVRLKGDVGIKANAGLTLRGVCALDLEGPAVTLVLANGALNTGSASIRAGVLNVVGGGSSSYLAAALSTSASSEIGSTRVTGSWRQVSSSPLTEFAIGFSGAVELGPVTGSLGALGYLFIDEGVVLRKPHIAQGGLSVRDAQVIGGYTPSLQAATASSSTRSKSLFSGLVFDAWAYTTAKATYKNCRLPTSSPQTLGSGSDSDFEACVIPSALTLNNSSGSACRFRDCELEGTLVLDSGAAARVTGIRGSGTLTNNDPLSIVTGSEDPADDTTPATRRFNNATLDAPDVLQSLIGYYRFGESAGKSFKSAAPFGNAPPISMNGDFTEEDILGDGVGIDFADTVTAQCSVGHLPSGTRAPFAISMVRTFDAIPGAFKQIWAVSSGGGTDGMNIAIDASGHIYLGVLGTIIITGTTVMTTGVPHFIVVERYWSGTAWTWRLWVDGAVEGTSTTSATTFQVSTTSQVIYLGRYSSFASWQSGGLAHLGLWSRSLESSIVSALYNSGSIRTLKGAAA